MQRDINANITTTKPYSKHRVALTAYTSMKQCENITHQTATQQQHNNIQQLDAKQHHN